MDPKAVDDRDVNTGGTREPGETRERTAIRSYVALGDSFTAGTGCDPGLGWADRLARALPDGAVYRNLAKHGATSADVREQVSEALQLEPDLVTVICGANDVLFNPRADVLTYSRNFGAILRRIQRAVPGVRLVTATQPERWDFLPVGPRTKARLQESLRRINQATRTLAAAHGAAVLEVASDPRLGDPENFSADGLHPSPLGHAKAARAFAALLRDEFGIEVNEEAL
jgi:lysophospholipase L1-like esterase